MDTLRQKPSKRKPRRKFKPLPIVVPILAVALLGLRLGQDGLPTSLRYPDEGEIQIHFIDVGQGDAALIRTDEGNMLIDAGTGNSEDYLRAYLDNLGVKTLRYAVFTHPDEDHIGGADMILRHYHVEQVILPSVAVSSSIHQTMMDTIEKQDVEILWASPDTTLNLGDLTCTLLAPLRLDYEDTNNMSVVLRLEYGDTSVLFTGDIELEAEAELLARYGSAPNGPLDCDLIKAGHHGSQTSSGQAFLRAVTPDFGVISCGAGNPHGHPNPSVLEAYRTVGAAVYRTDLEGSIVFVSTGGEPRKHAP